MGSAGNGAKAGLVAGIVYGVILAIVSYFTLVADKSTIIADITKSMPASETTFTPDQIYSIALVAAPIVVVVLGVLGGLVLGAIYGKVFERVPGMTSLVKGIIFGVVLWLLISVLGDLGDYGTYGALYYLSEVGTGLVGALIFGAVLGYFYSRFNRTKETYQLKEDVGALKVS